jgi:hypothetical protein
MINGEKVYLCSIERVDLESLRIWRNRSEYRMFFREYREISQDMQEKWYQTKVLDDLSTIMFAIRFLDSNELIGCCGLCYINWIHRNADLSLYIGWNNTYIDNEGYAEEATRLLLNYSFNELGLVKVWTEIYEFDELKVNLYKSLGFSQDGLLRKQYFYEGKWWNSRIMSILSVDYNES